MTAPSDTGCCPRFDPAPWDGQEITWQQKRFVRDRVRSVLHIPLNFGSVLARNLKLIEAADALESPRVLLSDENSLWGSDLFIAVTKPVPGAEMTEVSGTFLTKVFEGPYRHAGAWAADMTSSVEAKGHSVKKLFFFYTTCPRCAAAYGKNFTVLLAQV